MLNKTFYGIILPQFLLFCLGFIMYNVFYRIYSNHLASDHKYELLENTQVNF